MAFEFDIQGPTSHETAVSESSARKADEAASRLALLQRAAAGVTEEEDRAKLLVDMEMAQSELEFWRSKALRVSPETRHPGRGGYWLVPREPSRRALARAHGYTDLIDASCSPGDTERTMAEIALAVRIVMEEDGVAVLQEPDAPKALAPADIDVRVSDRKDLVLRKIELEGDLVRLSARFLELEEDLRTVAAGNMSAADALSRETIRERVAPNALPDDLEPSVREWRKLISGVTDLP